MRKRTKSCLSNGLVLTINRKEKSPFKKVNIPQREIYYSSIRTDNFELIFNPEGEIWMIRGLNTNWPHPYNWLTRSDGNDWIYYQAGIIENKRIINFTGENYLPCLTYKSNQIFDFNPYTDPATAAALAEWSMVYANLGSGNFNDLENDFIEFITKVLENGEDALHRKACELHGISNGRISVLPPDARHVNYELIPLMISEGCLYKCRFCHVKSENRYKVYSKEAVSENIDKLKNFYGEKTKNYSGLFLGDHDGLSAGFDLIEHASINAYEEFGFSSARDKPGLFLFGSVKSLKKAESFLENLERLPYQTYINVGFESLDQDTLDNLGKPVDASQNIHAFEKMIEVNKRFKNVEITGNFLIGEDLSPKHNQKIISLLSSVKEKTRKGGIYFSPLVNNLNRLTALEKFFEIKRSVDTIPLFIYLIMRL